MTFDAYETSANAGEPVFLFDFSTGLAHWRYTSADRPITYSTNVYAPLAIDASNILNGHEIRQRTARVTVPRSALVVERLQNYPPSTDMVLTIWELHYNDPDQQTIVRFIGRVMGQTQKQSVVELACEPAYTGVQTMGLRKRWQLNCPHVLYGAGCLLDKSPQKKSGTLSAVSGFSITAAGFTLATGLSFHGGFVEWDSGHGYKERRSIMSASGTTLTLDYGSPDLVAGLAVDAYPGCDHTTTNCVAFGNIANFGGAPNIPSQNPMSGNPVY